MISSATDAKSLGTMRMILFDPSMKLNRRNRYHRHQRSKLKTPGNTLNPRTCPNRSRSMGKTGTFAHSVNVGQLEKQVSINCPTLMIRMIQTGSLKETSPLSKIRILHRHHPSVHRQIINHSRMRLDIYWSPSLTYNLGYLGT